MFSIIIPCFNVEKYINSSVKSVLAQEYTNFELILINDGSTDKTQSLLNELKLIDTRVIVINQNNNGVSSARNAGIKCARGDYIYFLDADDNIEPDLLQNAYTVFNSCQDVDVFSFGYDIIHVDNKRILTFAKYDNQKFTSMHFLNMYFSKKIRQHLCSTLYRRSLIQNNRLFFSEQRAYGEDQDFELRAILHSRSIYYSSKCYFHYIKRADSAVNKKIQLKRLDLIKVLGDLELYFKNKSVDKQVINSLNNYQCITFFFLVLEGLKKKGDLKYFNQLIKFSGCLKKAKFDFSKYAFLIFFLSKIISLVIKPKKNG